MNGPDNSDWDWQTWWSSPRWPVRLQLVATRARWLDTLIQELVVVPLIFLGLALGPMIHHRSFLFVLSAFMVSEGVGIFVAWQGWSRLRRSAYLELDAGRAVLVAPSSFREPLVVPKTDVASIAVHGPKKPISAALESPPAGPIVNVAGLVAEPNCTLLFSRVLPLPVRASTRRLVPIGLTDLRGWIRTGRPIAGLRLRLVDPMGATPVLQVWLPRPSEPAHPSPGSTPAGIATEAAIRKAQRRMTASGGLVLLLLLVIAPLTSHPGTLVATAMWGALIGTLFWLYLRWGLRLRSERLSKTAVFAFTCITLVVTGFLKRTRTHWSLYGWLLGVLYAFVMALLEKQRRVAARWKTGQADRP